jgi:hypothetical protein
MVTGRLPRTAPVWLITWMVTSTSFGLAFVTVQTNLFVPNAPSAGVVMVEAATALLGTASASARTSTLENLR